MLAGRNKHLKGCANTQVFRLAEWHKRLMLVLRYGEYPQFADTEGSYELLLAIS